MYDLHYDLLTYVYMNKDNLSSVKKHLKQIFNNNISGGIFNLFYMSYKEMKEELGIYKEEINVINNLKEVDEIIKKEKLIPNDINYIYGIEGLDYLEDIDDIDILYDLGLRSVNIVWNNDNKFGSGAKGNLNRGLTNLGSKLVDKLIDKKIAIDLSHTNEKTFYDIVYQCLDRKNKGKEPIVFASHSNVYNLCRHPRNLKDEQIVLIKELNGVIGIVGVKLFCIQENKFNNNKEKYYNAYISHIDYINRLLGSIDNISASSDDMTYYKTKKDYYKYFNVFKQEDFKDVLRKVLLEKNYSEESVSKVLYKNFTDKILQRL